MPHWRQSQQKDPYFRKAKQEGYRARSAYKLLQIQEKFHILHPGNVIVDLGAAPGSWSQVAIGIVGERGRVVALDLQEIDEIPGVIILRGDMTAPEIQDAVITAAGGRADAVISDAAPFTSGIKLRDQALSMELARAALTVARRLLRPGGRLVIKIFEGPELQAFVKETLTWFQTSRIHAPAASRQESKETFLIAQGYKGSKEETHTQP